MNVRKLIALTLVLGLLLPAIAAAAPLHSAPLRDFVAGPCVAGAAYDPACDVDHDGDVDIFDVQETAGHWNQSGVWLSDNNHNHLGQTWTGSNNSLTIDGSFTAPHANLVLSNSASGDGLRVSSTGDDGVEVLAAGDDGVWVNSAGWYGLEVSSAGVAGAYIAAAGSDGVRVGAAGSPSSTAPASTKDGYEVAGAEGNGLYVGRADRDGVQVNSAGWSGLSVGSAGNGVHVGSAAAYGVFIELAAQDGVFVCRTGSASGCTNHVTNNGVEIGSAQHNGVLVNSAGNSGVYVNSAGYDGVFVNSAGWVGVFVNSAGHNGVDVTGNDLAGYFLGSIQVTGTCVGCLQATFGVNTGDRPLAPGDLVSLAGLRESGVDSVPMLMEVRTAAGGDAVVGVVQGWAELVTEEEPRPDEIGLRLVSREGPVSPSQYVTIAYSGLMQVKVSGPMTQGSKLAVGTDGAARALRTVNLDGVELAENASVIGVALESLDADEGLVWVLVNPQ